MTVQVDPSEIGVILNRNFFNPRTTFVLKKQKHVLYAEVWWHKLRPGSTLSWINCVLEQLCPGSLHDGINASRCRIQSMKLLVIFAVLLSITIGISEVSTLDQIEVTKKSNHDMYLQSNKKSPMLRWGKISFTLQFQFIDKSPTSFDPDSIRFRSQSRQQPLTTLVDKNAAIEVQRARNRIARELETINTETSKKF